MLVARLPPADHILLDSVEFAKPAREVDMRLICKARLAEDAYAVL